MAACRLVLFRVVGGIWFLANPPTRVDDGRHPVCNAWIFPADTLLPIIDLAQDGYRRWDGASQWIGSALVVAGRILSTMAAAGAAGILERVS